MDSARFAKLLAEFSQQVAKALDAQGMAAEERRVQSAALLAVVLQNIETAIPAITQRGVPEVPGHTLLLDEVDRKGMKKTLYLRRPFDGDGSTQVTELVVIADGGTPFKVSAHDAMDQGFRLAAIVKAIGNAMMSQNTGRNESAKSLWRDARRLIALSTLISK